MKCQLIFYFFCVICIVTATGNNVKGSDIQVYYNGETVVKAYVNESAHVAKVTDYFANITVILNGQSGTGIVEDRDKQSYYVLQKNAQTEGVLWISSKSDFKTFFKSISLKNIVKVAQQSGKNIGCTQDLIKAITPDLSLLGLKPSEDNFATKSKETIAYLNSTRFIFKGQGSFTVHKGIIWYRKLNVAFADIFRDSQRELLSLNVTYNLTDVYGASSGAEALLNLLSQIGNHTDLSIILRNRINSTERLLELLEGVSGGSNEGVDGIITVTVTVVRTIRGHSSFSDVIAAIFSYDQGTEGDSSSLTKVVNQALGLIEAQNRVYRNAAAFHLVIRGLKALNDHNLVYQSVNISDVISILTSKSPRGTVQALRKIFARFINGDQFPKLVSNFIERLNSSNGLSYISKLYPGIDPNSIRDAIIKSNILESIRSGNLTSLGNSSELTPILSQFPIIRDWYKFIYSKFDTGIHPSDIANPPQLPAGIPGAGIVSGIEHAAQNFASGLIGIGGNGASPPSPSPPPLESIRVTSTSVSSHETDSSTAALENNETEGRSTESTVKSTPTTSVRSISINDTVFKLIPIARKVHAHRLHEKKDAHHHEHLHSSNRKENLHHKHKLQEKGGNHHQAGRQENVHSKHKFQHRDGTHHQHLNPSHRNENHHHHFEQQPQEKGGAHHHHHHLSPSNRKEDVHYRHKLLEKENLSKKHHRGTQEKKNDDHHHHPHY